MGAVWTDHGVARWGARKAYRPVAVHGRYLCHTGGGTELRVDDEQTGN